jgi:ATP-dependent helicase/nuclease subunit A
MWSPMSAAGLTLVSASAGSGKTYRLSHEVRRALTAHDEPLPPHSLVAVTYTTKAQAELTSRLRRDLIEQGHLARAESLPLAYLGTVHAVCLRLIKEFALDAGLSPSVDGLPQEAARRLLQESLEWALDATLRARVEALAATLELNLDSQTKNVDWIKPVEQIMTLARNNRLAPETLTGMAERSWAEFYALLGPPLSDGASLERQLRTDIEAAIAAIERLADGQNNTQTALDTLKDAQRALSKGRLPWSEWNKLAKLSPGKRALLHVEAVHITAEQYITHPQFHTDVRELCGLLFQVAQVGLTAYAHWKEQRGLVDYVDMIDRALSLLDVPEVQAELTARLKLLVVDEFQDSSPVQLALFSRVHALCGRSLWVGDRKQCIFEYAGADPSLMDAVNRWAAERSGHTEILQKNYRSRPELVDLVSALFSRAFAGHGHNAEEVVTSPTRQNPVELAALAPVGVWWVDCQREVDSIAEGVCRLLAEPSSTPVWDRQAQCMRPLQAHDIVVLVATNSKAEALASALKRRGITSALARTGLMTTPEGTLLVAALRFLADPHDTLASAELEALLGFPEGDHQGWLSSRIAAHANKDHTRGGPVLQTLNELRRRASAMAPSEAVDLVMSALDFAKVAWRWPDHQQRLSNLDALRALVVKYEARATYLREAASLQGLLRYFEESKLKTKHQDEERASDEQHVVGQSNAVALSTYHKSKGLEWPVVVLANLDHNKPRELFDVHPDPDRDTFDAEDPLGQRWIRYWPWPLGLQRGATLRDRAADSAVGKKLSQRESRERVRLLYVGFTRARDHLILAVGKTKKGDVRSACLDELKDAHGPLLELPVPHDGSPTVRVRGEYTSRHESKCRVWTLTGADGNAAITEQHSRRWYTFESRLPGALPYVVNPSDAINAGMKLPTAQVVFSERFSRRMPFEAPAKSWDEVGTAVHSFLAADDDDLSESQRHSLGERILLATGLNESFAAPHLIAASDALRQFVAKRWPHAKWHREVPLEGVLDTPDGARAVRGTIDLWLETAEGGIVIDHKSYPGASSEWHTQALKHAPQLFTYGLALRASNKRVLGYFVHFAIGGGIVEVGEC